MAIKQINVYCLAIEDKPGSLQRFLSQSSLSNVDFECFAAFSVGDNSGRVYISARNEDAFEAFLKEAGIKSTPASGFIVDGEDKVGAAAEALKALAEAGISGIAGAALVCDGQYRMLVVVDTADGDAAAKLLGA